MEWLAQQPWCDGQVNMIGSSYGCFTSVQVAAQAPPHLTSIIPMYFTDDRYTDDVHHRGGLLRMWCDPGYYSGFNLTRRDSLAEPDPLVPGEVMEIDLPLQATGWTFTAGNRIRVSLASADFPEMWPTPQAGTTTVHRGTGRPSRLVLPTVPEQGSAPPPSFEPSKLDIQARLAPSRTWAVTDDVVTGARSVQVAFESPSGRARRQLSVVCRVDPARPDAASVHGHCVITRPFGSLTLEARSEVVIQGTESHLQVTIDLELLANGARHASRHWVESIPRALL